ncbi:MAG: hypothetical protein KA956_10840 [Pyrinomonadaceae bacterium]|nr:hypothetical protein [Pyrinomonadaceae bacterium]
MNLKRVFLYLLITSVAISALLGIGVILFGNFGELEVRVLMTTLTVTVTSILGLACGAYYETGRGRNLPLAGIVLSLVSALMVFLIIWNVLDDNSNFIKATLTAVMLAVSCSHLSLLSIARLDRRFAWSQIAAFVFVAVLDAILLYILWFEPTSDSDLVSRIIGVLSILIASITVITPVFHKLSAGGIQIADIDAEILGLQAKITELEAKKAELTGNQEPE